MNISSATLDDVVNYLCNDAQKAAEDLWANWLPNEVIQSIFRRLSSLADIQSSSLVCKVWSDNTRSLNVGTVLLNRANIRLPDGANWIKVYSNWLNSNFVIALDQSASMWAENEPWRHETAMEKVKEIALQLEPVMRHKGVEVISFGSRSTKFYARSAARAIAYLQNDRRFRGGTNINDLLKSICNDSDLLKNVYLISDMVFNRDVLQQLDSYSENLRFQMIQIGNHRGRFIEALEMNILNGHFEEEAPIPNIRKRKLEVTLEKVSEKRTKTEELELSEEDLPATILLDLEDLFDD